MDLLRKSNSTSQEHGKSEGHAQDLALEGFDTVIMRGREIGEVSNSFERPDTANVRIIVQMMGPNVSLEYRTTKLGHRQARSMAAAIETVISALVYEPSVTMGGLNWCDEEDANILDKWNSLDSTWIEECVHELIAKQATEQPHKSAVDAWDGHLTYRELDRLSSILASHLTLLGVAPETFVALCFEKSKWLVVSILAVIKAGGAYVVIEPYYPFSRMQDICTVLRINILLASRDLLHTATKLSDQVVVVEAGSECLKERHDEWQWEARSPCSPHNALYVVFSSGSTGKPKGIIVEHASFATWGTLLKQAVCLDADSRVLQFSSFAFLIAHRDVLLTLMFGGCVCMPSESQRLNHLETFIAKHRVNWANLTPSVAALLDPAMTPELKTLLLTSEPMSLKSLATWEGNVNLLFAYGQAESVSLCCVRNSPTVGSDRKNVGHRIGRSIWLVDPDDHNKLVPVGAVGELVIQGPVLARGYLDPETTALAFLRDTAWLRQLRPRYQGKLYKTGDLAQFTDDGSVRYIGRKDNSAKLHGQRLDLDLVLQHVQRCLVEMSDTEVCNMVIDLSYSPHFEDVKLTAFLGFSPTSTDTEDSVMLGPLNRAAAYLHDFQSRLVNVIPRHMIPTLVVIVSHIPLNLSGKIDRRKLREILSQMTASEVALCLGSIASHEAPCTDRELKLRSLWSQALNTVESNIGRLDDFFRRGGDSLAAMRLASAAHALGLDLTFGDIFANPVLSNQAEHIGSDKRQTNRDYSCGDFELITQAQKQAIIVAAAADHALSASQIKDIYPTTPMQQGLIALDALRPGSYLSQRVYQIKTGVSLRKLESAWGAVMDANPPLRTRVIRRADDGLTYQVVIRGQTKLHMAHNLPKYLADDEAKPMGLGEPLLRLAIVSNTNGEPTHCVVTIHHCIYDAWSMAILLDQVSDAYHDRALVARNFRHFVKYVCESNANSSEYWRSETNGVVAEQFPALPAPSYSLNTAEREILNTTLSQSVAAAANITLATRIQLAWAMTIAAYTGVDDVVYGLTVSGRASPVQGIDKMAGPTIATFPLRVQLRSSSSIHQELDMLQRRVIATIPFEQFGLQNISRLGDDAARACKFQSLLVIQQSQSAAETKSDILTDVEDSAVRPRWNTYALSLLCTPFRGGAVRFEAVYDATVVPKAQMRRILQVFVNILKQVTVSPDRLVGDVDSISAQDLEQIQRWNPSLQQAVPKCVHAMIHDQCVSQPNAIAVDAWDGQLSYKELEEQSSLLSMSLKEKGLGHDMFVPLCFEKSKWVAVGILAVLKAGSAFILLDPSHPAERLARICENSQATAVLCSRNTVGLAAKLSCPHVIQVDEKLSREHQVAPAAQALQPTKTLPSHALCALYTSGSTGTPKGIIIEHSAVATQVTALESHFHLDRQSRIFQFASHAFDVAVSDYLFALALGGCVCVPKETDSRDNLARAIRGCRANWVFLTPSVARSLQPSAVPEIETMVIGGESAKRLDFATWSSAVRLIYVYGPAEGTVFCTLQTKTSSGADPINIGSAVAAACWLVDCANSEKLVAIGAVGELMIEGPIVGRGYIGNDSSGSSFISAPKWLRNLRRSESPSRLYKTGDLMRYSPVGDGSLEFVGRKDRQAKLRGQRMELAEIEHQVSQHFPGATDAVVEIIAPPESDSQKLLAAFVWDATSAAEPLFDRGPGTSSKPSIFSLPDAEFQSRASIAEVELRKRLPPFMIPSLFIPLNELPFGPTGKADRRLIKSEASSLSRQELSVYHSSGTSRMRGPSNESESAIRQLVAGVLGLNPNDIGMNDNFFQLGGDSISAMVLSTRASDVDLKLTAADILGYPRLCDMAVIAVREEMGHGLPNEQNLLPRPFSLLPANYHHETLMREVTQQCHIDESDVDDIYPCTPLQAGLFSLTMKQPTAYVFSFTLHLAQDVDMILFEEALDAVIDANPILRTRIVCATSMAGSMLQVVLSKTSYKQLSLQASRQYAVDLGHPLFSVQILSKDKDENHCRAVLTLHHALYDDVSLRLMLVQLSDAYYGRKSPVSQPYKCFIQHCLSLPPDNDVKSFWADELASAAGSTFTRIPSDSYLLQSPKNAECCASLSSESTTTVPLAAALKLAWGSVVSAFTGEADAIFGTVVSGRMASLRNIHKIAGPTIATVPFRVRQVPAMTIQDALDEVQSRSLRMIRYEQTGLQRLRQLGFAEACQFQSLLIVQFSEEGDIVESPLYKVVLEEPGGTFQTYPLTIVCTPSAKSVHIRATFDSELMSAALVNRLLTQFSAAVAHITNLPRKCMSSIPSLSIGDAKKIWMWNRSVPQRENSCIHDIITKNAAARRETPAVCAWDGGFTYDELEDLSSKLAKRLQGFGVATGSMVPLCFEKSRWTVVAMLAVLKAGYTFVPLDVSQAAGRRDVILARIRADIILASAKCAELLAATKRVVLVVDEVSLEALPPRPPAGALLSREATERPGTSAAYVLFTSGSTGQPKGVVVDHSALSTSCLAHGSRMGFSERTRMLQFTSHTFDISLAEIFTTLIFGGCVCIPSEDDRFSGLELSVDAMKVNTVCLTASVARLVEPHRMPSLDTIIFVGENATEDDFKKWMHLSQVFDAYGPTECTIFCSINRVQTSSGAGSVIGEAVGSVSWVVSPGNHDHLLPIGAVGELLVEGPVLARGYLDDAGKTSAVFIEDPSWLVQGTEGYAGRRGRLYKTGDLVHYNEDGSLTYCGRKDTQVKIRGHRVELEEVECHLRNCVAGAHQAAVVSVALSIDDCASRLTAFLCFDAEASPPEDQVHAVTLSLPVRDNLADHLPAYMVPSAYLAIRRLPLNTAGKLDRRRLREIVVNYFERRGAKSDTVPKQGCSKEESVWLHRNAVGGAVFSPLPSPFRDCSTETERRVRSAWAAVLGLPNDRISTDDNFYDIGGDSIRVIRLMKVIENEFGVRLWSSLVNSRKTTISKMAEYIETRPEMDSIDLEGDIAAALGSPWASAVSEPWFSPVGSLSGPATVFLTGGTGFLGTHILRNLLTSTTVARVAVLVRAASAVEGMERVKKTALMAEWWKAEHERRIDVWIGDLELRRLGLGESQWSRLSGTAAAGNISTIIHSGAVVNWNMDYDRLRSPNVLSTVELLRAAALSHAAPRFVFVSGGAMAELDVNPGDTAAMEQLSRSSGYAQSKFAAEAITRRFAARLPPSQNRFSVVKPGMIIGPADTGVANLDDFLWRVVAAASRLRLYPVDDEEEDSWVSVTDADFVATQVVAQVLPADRGHVAPYVAVASRHGLGAADFWAQVNAELKHACEPVSWPAWVERALQQTRHVGESHPLWPVQEFLVAAGKGKKHGGGGISTASPLVAPDKAVLCEAVRANLRHLGRVGFVETRQSSLSTTRHGVFRRSAAAPASCS
ncbi:hypothetical protein V2A60_007184 [Cordyceps javanica]|uniref:Amino acid adenylation domain-containing protein n=1 Tax=Cordyceps javanica TaxID=43265 RepID=A0A545USR7_9HYPO|nr:amino acid adenylation domain-containing protein [Cordyceps javanica]